MDNIPKTERGGGGKSLGGGLSFFGIVILFVLWTVLIEYIIFGVVIVALVISLVVKLFGK